jgi:hypothetical protein
VVVFTAHSRVSLGRCQRKEQGQKEASFDFTEKIPTDASFPILLIFIAGDKTAAKHQASQTYISNISTNTSTQD